MLFPDPAAVPPQLPLYHCQVSPAAREPPERVKVDVPPEQMEAALGLTDPGTVEPAVTLTVTGARSLTQVPLEEDTKYVVLVVIAGVT